MKKSFLACISLATLSALTLTGCQDVPRTDKAAQKTTRTADLFQLQVSKEQVESSSFEGRTGGGILGNVGYVQGSSEGKPVTDTIFCLISNKKPALLSNGIRGSRVRISVEENSNSKGKSKDWLTLFPSLSRL